MLLNLSRLFAEKARNGMRREILVGMADAKLAHPTDSHPPLGSRLEALGLAIEDVANEALTAEVSEPAIGLLDDPEKFEKQITIAYQELLARHGGINLQSLPPDQRPPGPSWAAKRRRERARSRSRRR